MNQRAGQSQFLFHATGELSRAALFKTGEADELKQFHGALLERHPPDAAHLTKELQVFKCGKVPIQAEALREVTHPGARLLGLMLDIVSLNRRCTGIRTERADE